MRSQQTCYDVLGVRPQASTEEIRSAYRRLMRAVHPDVGGTAALFDEVQHAYEILNDPSRRRRYDAELASIPARPRPRRVGSGSQRYSVRPEGLDPWWRRFLNRPAAYALLGALAVMATVTAVTVTFLARGRDTTAAADPAAAVATTPAPTPSPTDSRLRAGAPVNIRGRVLTVTADRTAFRVQPTTGAALVVRITDRTAFGTASRPTNVTSVAPGKDVRVIAGQADGFVVAWRVIPVG